MALFGTRKKCFCAFCKSERMVYTKRRINFINILAAAVVSVLTMAVIWQSFDPKVMLFFVFYLALAEAFVQIRWRLNIVCKYCGFDPVLYLKDSDRAALNVKIRLDERKNDPATILKVPLDIPFLKKKKDSSDPKIASASDKKGVESSKGRFVSKQI